MHPFRLPELAVEVSMSASALSHFFKKRIRRNLVDYINDIRMGYATKMLFETTNSIAEIAFLCGFNNVSNFNRIFKKQKGQTPNEYRTNIHQVLTKY
jgi:transcriptional regulator GlxA family with amidase domain